MTNNKFLITASLYNSYHYYAKSNFDMYGEKAEETEARALQDFKDTLNKVSRPKTEIMQRGIDFENEVLAACDGNISENTNPTAIEIANKVRGGIWQVKLTKTIGNFVLYGIADIIKGNTIHDIKRVTQYDCPKYEYSIQHLLYMECAPIENFIYQISDGKNSFEEYYHKDSDNQAKLLARINNMVNFINSNNEFKTAFENNWRSKY